MTERIREHIAGLLKDAPRTRRIVDLEEELLAGCLDKYADLTASGVDPEEAYRAVTAGIGDVDELIGAARKGTNDTEMLGAVSSALWPLITLCYLFLGFIFHLWHPGWLIFPLGALLQLLITAAFTKGARRKGAMTSSLYVAAAIVFLVFGFTTMKWHIGCLIFVMAVAAQQILRLIRVWRNV